MTLHANHSIIDQYLPTSFKNYIEQEYYQKVTLQSLLENLKGDEAFLESPIQHIGLYSDHGIPHVRDVAVQIIDVLDTINGVLIPKRDKNRLDFMKGYGVAIAYLHDIGMRNFSSFGRFMHPEFAAQTVFNHEMDAIVRNLWDDNAGNVAWRILQLSSKGILFHDPIIVFKEMLSLSVCHSKSKVPVALLNNPAQLVAHMQHIVSTPLQQLFCSQKVDRLNKKLTQTTDTDQAAELQAQIADYQQQLAAANQEVLTDATEQYPDFKRQAYECFLSTEEYVQDLVLDVIDTLRALRSADALRQRGTVYRTSAGYEVFVDQNTASAIYALRSHDNETLYMLRAKKPLNAGEANMASSEIDKDGNLRIAFHRGQFNRKSATKKAAFNAAVVIDDIQADVIQSFERAEEIGHALPQATKKAVGIQILIERAEDNTRFADMVCQELTNLQPDMAHRCRSVASLQQASLDEVKRYLAGDSLEVHFKGIDDVKAFLNKVAASGHRTEKIDVNRAFNEVRIVHVKAGETLITAGSPSGFVYIPFDAGLTVIPLGGYSPSEACPFVPLGNTGVIRGSERNAQIMAHKAINLMMIPKQVYLDFWYHPYSQSELVSLLRQKNRAE